MINTSPENAAEAAKHVKGATIAWGGNRYLDLLNPNPESVDIEDYAYALAYTVRWRGQNRSSGRRCFYGVGEHCVRGAEQMIRDGCTKREAFDFLGHESDEVPFGDSPGPSKQLWSPEYRATVNLWGAALDIRHGFGLSDPELIKRYDIRLLVTEKRDILAGHETDVFSIDGERMADDRYAPFPDRIVPYRHPDQAAVRWLAIYHHLKELI